MAEQATASSDHVAAAEPVIRRVVAARAANPADIDDLVQDCLERLLAARGRLDPEAVLPFAIVTARNLVSSNARNAARRAMGAPRIADVRQPDRPEDVVLARESRAAMTVALDRLTPEERSDVLAYYDNRSIPAGDAAQSRGALRVRMSRTRAKLRLEYLLAYRHLELRSPLCRRVLLAISSGDTRRQRELDAGQHLLSCDFCATLSEPLDRRSIALTAISIPGGLAAWAIGKIRAHPVHAAATVTASSAVVAVAAVLGPKVLTSPPPAHAHPHPAAAQVKPQARMISDLSINGRPVADSTASRSIRSLTGDPAYASGITVEAVPTHNGFWVGSADGRIWVELVGPLEPLRIQPGDRIRFTGTVVGNEPSYPARIGLTKQGGAALLAVQEAHLAVSTTKVKVQSR